MFDTYNTPANTEEGNATGPVMGLASFGRDLARAFAFWVLALGAASGGIAAAQEAVLTLRAGARNERPTTISWGYPHSSRKRQKLKT